MHKTISESIAPKTPLVICVTWTDVNYCSPVYGYSDNVMWVLQSSVWILQSPAWVLIQCHFTQYNYTLKYIHINRWCGSISLSVDN